MKINHLDLFSGIGGFHLGFERAGYKVNSYFSEIDAHAVAVYKHQFPKSTYVGSVKDVRGTDLPRIDLITFGSPCQDFSLAGKRKGMEGDRSSLILEAIRLIRECRPRVFIWENVKGTFSSNAGEDFAAILQEFANTGGYRLEWQLLNTSWFLPQNRERIYLVGYSAATKRNWSGVFPIGKDSGETVEPSIKQIGTKFDSNGGTQPYQQDRVYDSEGILPALNQGKSDLILRVKSATSQGYEEATGGDSINFSQPNSETRRGRVGKQKAQTLETSCNQAVVQPNYGSRSLNETIERNTLTEGEPKALDLYNRQARDESPTLTEPHHNSLRLFDGYRIRRLTPIECERLQGFPDDHTAFGNYDGEVKIMSNTQRYKQCGNAVTVDVVASVADKVKPLFK
jgi:DNA (cytosine-5)-methyltransferase 1